MPATHATGLYAFSLERQNSLVAGKNFISLYNPPGSGTVLTVGAFFVAYMATVAGAAYPMRGYRVSAEPTGGTLHANNEICPFDTKVFDPKGVIRSNDPAVALGPAFFNSTPGTVKDTVGQPHEVDAPPGFNPFLLRPGEGVVMRQNVGTVGHFWNVSIIWRQLRG